VPDEERVDALAQESEVVQRQVPSLELLAARVEVEIETIDSVDLGEAGLRDASLDGAVEAALLLLVAEAVEDLEDGQVFLGRLGEDLADEADHAG
jgi:hypothetical protein